MSAIIDEMVFRRAKSDESCEEKTQELGLAYEVMNKLKLKHKHQIVKNNPKSYLSTSTVQLSNHTFLVTFQICKQTCNPKLSVLLLDSILRPAAQSKHNDLLLMKMFLKRSREIPLESHLYVHQGRVLLNMTTYTSLTTHLRASKVIEVYNQLIIKNLLNFQNFMVKHILDIGKSAEEESQRTNQFQRQLQLARVSRTVHGTSNISIAKSQFKFANSSLEKLKIQINAIKQSIVEQEVYQKTVGGLYGGFAEEVSVGWLKENYVSCYMENDKKLNALLNYNKQGVEKKVQDFVFNTVKLEIKEMLGSNKHVNEGGFTYIYAARAAVTYISSTDLNSVDYNCEKAEKLVAIKKLKPTELKKQRNKVEHQKEIVTKMRGSTCPFIPKYFGTKQSEFNHVMLMEFIQGEELDTYLSKHSWTISFWSKVYQLTNIVHAVRHLNNYQIVHLDLKPGNVLVSKNLTTKLIDFGEAYHPEVCPKDYAPGFTFPYVAPQVYIRYARQTLSLANPELQYSQKQDMFGFGMMMFENLFEDKMFHFSTSKFKEVYAKREVLQRLFLAPERMQGYGCGYAPVFSALLYLIVCSMDPEPQRRPRFQWVGICLKLILNSYINIS